MTPLVTRLRESIQAILRRDSAAWIVWCDRVATGPPLLERATEPAGAGDFMLLQIDERTLGQFGGPVSRRRLQQQIDRGERFVLWIPVPADRLGWLWAQSLLAEHLYDRSLRDQLRDWSWRPDRLTITDDELAALARRNLEPDRPSGAVAAWKRTSASCSTSLPAAWRRKPTSDRCWISRSSAPGCPNWSMLTSRGGGCAPWPGSWLHKRTGLLPG